MVFGGARRATATSEHECESNGQDQRDNRDPCETETRPVPCVYIMLDHDVRAPPVAAERTPPRFIGPGQAESDTSGCRERETENAHGRWQCLHHRCGHLRE